MWGKNLPRTDRAALVKEKQPSLDGAFTTHGELEFQAGKLAGRSHLCGNAHVDESSQRLSHNSFLGGW